MARVSLIDKAATPEIAALVAKIRGARGGRLHAFYQALLHNPALASAWFDFNNTVRFETGLTDRVRELVIMRVAALTGCDYVWSVHQAHYAAPAGVTARETGALRDRRETGVFEARDSVLLDYVDAMTQKVAVPDAVFDALHGHYSERETVEITVLIAAYNMHTRLLKALDIRPAES